MADRVVRAEAWISNHETRCDERYRQIDVSITEVKFILQGWRKAMWAAALGLIMWGGSQLYNDLRPHDSSTNNFNAAPIVQHK